MRPDYKLSTPARVRRKGRYRVLLALGVLATTFASVKFLDLHDAAGQMSAHAPPQTPISTPLELPNTGVSATLGDAPALTAADIPSPPQPIAPTAVTTEITVPSSPPGRSIATVEPAAVPSLLDRATEPTGPAAPLPPSTDDPTSEPTASVASDDPPPAQTLWREHQIASGESLARIFDEQGLEPGLLHRIIHSGEEAKSLAQVRPGQTLRFQFDENNELVRLELHRNRVDSLRIAIADDAIDVEQVSKALDTRVASASGLIESSLFVDGQKAGLADTKIMELASIFGWDIDFALEIRAGDQFRVVYEEQYLDGEKLRDGPILAAEFSNRGKTFRAIRYEDSNGEIGYYDAKGNSKRRAFIRTPIKFARVSSRFNPKRWHPVLKRWRSHKGVDYAAPTGTPIKASGDGKVVFRGTKGGYGRTVILKHAGKYTTLYAHMSKYSNRAKVGKRVKQGQVIGYVGRSGLASGPHLHYEFRVNGVHKDPLRIKLPKSLALPKSELPAFKKVSAPLLARLEATPIDTIVASNEGHKKL